MIEARAPGKVVLWGEYAVLAGAPALVMAVDRFACCSLSAGSDHWLFSSAGHSAAPDRVPGARLDCAEAPPPEAVWSLFWAARQELDGALPDAGRAHFDTTAFYAGPDKLGLGSSAALSVAVYAALCRLLEQRPDYEGARNVHQRLQGGGSGIDVAAAWHGGLLRFHSADAHSSATPWTLPEDLHKVFVWSGRAARTMDHVARFDAWRQSANPAPLDALIEQSQAVFEASRPLPALADYVACLRDLDRAGDLGIFTAGHEHLSRLAIDAGVVYKPCGAGGGDLGAAFCADLAAAERFRTAAAAAGFPPLALETAPHGFEVTG